jgi:vacuolar-type H+-ATPase subunit C/Vma6
MPDAGERAYAYAKACGIIGKSFVGKRVRGLERASRLSELDRIVFSASAKSLPEKELLRDLEKRIIGREVNSIISIVECFSKPPEFLTLLIRSYEYTDLLSAINASREKEKIAPSHVDLGNFQTVRFGAWPDIHKMIAGTAFEFLLDKLEKASSDKAGISLQSLLDQHYYSALWNALLSLPTGDRQAAQKILSDEISLKNSSWALRLRTFYQMSADEIKPHLVDVLAKGKKPQVENLKVENLKVKKPQGNNPQSLAKEALACLDFQLDNYSDWASWRWKDFLNPPFEARHWQADPRFFQNAASRYLYNLARHNFRLNPSSLDMVFCFIKLKQFEEDVLTSSAEGLGIGMSVRDTISMLGVE